MTSQNNQLIHTLIHSYTSTHIHSFYSFCDRIIYSVRCKSFEYHHQHYRIQPTSIARHQWHHHQLLSQHQFLFQSIVSTSIDQQCIRSFSGYYPGIHPFEGKNIYRFHITHPLILFVSPLFNLSQHTLFRP